MRTPDIRRAKLTRLLALDHNELRRRSDRIEAWFRLALITVFVPLAVLGAMAAAQWVHDAGARELRPAPHVREVTAVLVRGEPAGGSAWYLAPARWTADGVTQRGYVPALPGAKAGSAVAVWVDAAGRVQRPPLTTAELSARVVLALFAAPLAVATGLWLAWRVLRWQLDRRRLARWDEAWSLVGPQWTR